MCKENFGARTALLGLAFVAALAASLPARADLHNSFQVHVSVNNNSIERSGGLSNSGTGLAETHVFNGATVDLAITASQFTAARSSLSGTGNGYAKLRSSAAYSFKLQPPAGGAIVKGGKLVLRVALEASATGDADVHLVTAVSSDMGKGTGSAIISDASTGREEFDVVVPIAPFVEDISIVNGDVHQYLDATARLGGSGTSVAEAKNGTRVVNFRVFNSAGAQITGFTMLAAGGNIPEGSAVGPTPPPTSAKTIAVEFYNASFKHYFLSANPAEIAKLDDGTFAGWTRTGQTFNVNSTVAAGLVAVCRFFTVAFPPTSSHFYAPRGLGCEGTLTYAKWQYEGEVFYVPAPTAAGACPAGSIPVYRLYNNGRGGAPNHRFTTSEAIRTQMLAEGFIPEGAGEKGVGFCSPQ